MPNMRLAACRRAGFSLIELLVVVIIIAVLAAMLMPAIATMRTAARTSACRSNLRQVYFAFAGYAADQDGWVASGNDAASNFFWYLRIAAYAEGTKTLKDATTWGDIRITSVIAGCPEARTHGLSLNASCGYGMNFWLRYPELSKDPATFNWPFGNALNPSGGWYGAYSDFLLSGISMPSTRALINDASSWSFESSGADSGWGGGIRHRWRHNMLFCDGHVASVDPRRVTVGNARSNPAAFTGE